MPNNPKQSKIPEEAELMLETVEAVCAKLGVKFIATASVCFTIPDPADPTKTIEASDFVTYRANVSVIDVAKMLFATAGVVYSETLANGEIKD